jgi:hypothetical protein
MTTAEQCPASGVSSADVLGLPREQRSRPEDEVAGLSNCGPASLVESRLLGGILFYSEMQCH